MKRYKVEIQITVREQNNPQSIVDSEHFTTEGDLDLATMASIVHALQQAIKHYK